MAAGRKRYWLYSASLAAIVAVAVILALRVQRIIEDERRSIIETASVKLLYSVEIVARSLDGLLRLADEILEDEAGRISLKDRGSALRSIVAVARRLPEAQNVYLLDESGLVVASSWPRKSPSLELPAGSLERAALAGNPRTHIARAPVDGGECLATVAALPGTGGFAAILFSMSVVEGRAGLLRAPGLSAAVVREAVTLTPDGLVPEPDSPDPPRGVIGFETMLESRPLRIGMRSDARPLLAEWKRNLLVQASVAALALLATGALLLYALFSRRKASRAASLERELEARELLFHEINHRVKNNLSIAQSILSLGESQIGGDPGVAGEVLRASAERIRSMSMLHEQLYRRRALDAVELGPYLVDLSESLSEAYLRGKAVRISADTGQGLLIDPQAALPVALIVTELVTNACKHAYPPGSEGRIRVSAFELQGGSIGIRVEDDGAWKEGGDAGRGFGRTLVEALTAQLGVALVQSVGQEGHGLSCYLELPAAFRRTDREGAPLGTG